MIRPDNTVKALVPYEPYKRSNIVSAYLCSIFCGRKGIYLFFIILLFLFSAFSRCVFVQNPGVSGLLYEDIKNSGNTVKAARIFEFCTPYFVSALFSFLSGFTAFALPFSTVAFVHFLYRLTFFYFSLVENTPDFGFQRCLLSLLSFSALLTISLVFYAESAYAENKKTLTYRVYYSLAFVIYLFIVFFAVRFLLILCFV